MSQIKTYFHESTQSKRFILNMSVPELPTNISYPEERPQTYPDILSDVFEII